MKVVVSHPTGNQFSRALLAALSKAGALGEFHTSIAVNPEAWWLNVLPAKIKQEALRRTYPLAGEEIQTHPLLELARLTLPKAGLRKCTEHEVGWASVDAVYRDVDQQVAKRLAVLKKNNNKPDAVYGYEDGALSSFREAKQLGIKCLYDLPIGYWRAGRIYLKAEQERWPDWAATLPGFRDSDDKLQRKDEELILADHVFVASKFTAKTLGYFPGTLPPVSVVPYGFPLVTGTRNYNSNISNTGPLKLIFVGGLSQRKGIADFFALHDAFGDRVSLTIVGYKAGDNCPVLNEALAKHRWIPSLPHQEVLKLMREHDVLIFPSLFEGFGLVITEAMAQGTPVITTDRTAGPDVIKDNENGWLIEAGRTEKLIEAVENILLHPALVANAGRAAMEAARKRPWEIYGQEMLRAIIDNS